MTHNYQRFNSQVSYDSLFFLRLSTMTILKTYIAILANSQNLAQALGLHVCN